MQETIRLFDEDSHETLFEGCVLSCEEDGDLYKVVLNQTLFFPEEGGQTCDKGTLNDIPVEKVLEKNRVIYHWVKEPLWEGDTVTGIIDWEKRFSDMQQHSGEHIVSGLMHEYFKFDNVGFHLGSECVTMDFNGVLTEEQLRMIERKANEAVVRNIEVQVIWPSKEELVELPYRSKKPLEGPVRIVEIPGYDICACCAPHVRRTGEIGMIRLVGMEKYKGGIRVEMLCGFRAMADYLEKEKNVNRISRLLSAKPYTVADAAEKLKAENTALKQEISALKMAILEKKIEQLPENAVNVCLFDEHLDKSNMRYAFNLMMKRCRGICACFEGDDEKGYRYVLGGQDADVTAEGKKMNAALNGRGGGSKDMFQGNVQALRSDIEDYFFHLNK
ncbi:MAG: alanyl-tRNA editing protein [Coprococcus sp.]